MTTKKSNLRFAFYCFAAFLTPITTNWSAMAGASLYDWGGVLVQSLTATIIAGRAYIDESPAKVQP